MKGAANRVTANTLQQVHVEAVWNPLSATAWGPESGEKVGRWVFGIAAFYCVSMFLVPFMMPEDSVPELSGRANTFDYYNEDSWGNQNHREGGRIGHNQSAHGGTFAWSELNPYYAFVYAFGDLNCHQKFERSWTINGNQMPVCARDVGIFLGLALGGWWFSVGD